MSCRDIKPLQGPVLGLRNTCFYTLSSTELGALRLVHLCFNKAPNTRAVWKMTCNNSLAALGTWSVNVRVCIFLPLVSVSVFGP